MLPAAALLLLAACASCCCVCVNYAHGQHVCTLRDLRSVLGWYSGVLGGSLALNDYLPAAGVN